MLKKETHVSRMNLPLLFWFLCVCYIRFSTILYNAVCLLSINLWMITKQITKHEKKRTLHKKHRKNISYCRKCDRTYGIQIYWLFFNSVFFTSLFLVRSFFFIVAGAGALACFSVLFKRKFNRFAHILLALLRSYEIS